MKHSLKQFREKRVIMWDGIMWLWIATKADSSKQITDISDSMKGWRLWLGECQLLQVKNFMEFTGFICFRDDQKKNITATGHQVSMTSIPDTIIRGLWRRVVWCIRANVSEEPAASTFKIIYPKHGDGRFLRDAGIYQPTQRHLPEDSREKLISNRRYILLNIGIQRIKKWTILRAVTCV